MYDFDSPIDRTGTGAIKWDRCPPELRYDSCPPLSIADQEFAVAPEIREAVHRAADRAIYGYTDPDDVYLDAVTSWMARRHGFTASPQDIVTVSGVIPALAIAIRAFTKPGDGVLVMPPVYPPFFSIIRQNGRTVVENPLVLRDGRYEMDFDDLENKAPQARMLLLCNPHNPVGRVWTEPELRRLADLCVRHRIFVASDEIHGDLVHPPRRHTVFASVTGRDGPDFLTGFSPSKTFNMAGMQNASAYLPDPELRMRFVRQMGADGFSNMGYFARAAAISAYTLCDAWLDGMLAYVRGNYALLAERLARILPDVPLYPMEGMYLAWSDFRPLAARLTLNGSCSSDGSDGAVLERFLRERARIVLSDGYHYGTGGDGFERFNLALPQASLEKALDRLADAVSMA